LSYILIGCGLMNVAIKGISKKSRDCYYNALEKADDQFEIIHRKIEAKKVYEVQEVDQGLITNSFDEFLAIVTDSLNASISRLKEIDMNNIDKEAKLSLSDLAKIYNYSKNYLRNLINRGKLKGEKRGKTWYVRVKDMADYIQRVGAE